MNRYTFKAKRKDNREWVYGNVIINPNSTDKVVIVESGVTSYSSTKEAILEFINDYVEVIPETLCQCTGLQDIEGNYIFENDKVKAYYEDKGEYEFVIHYIESYGCFCLTNYERCVSLLFEQVSSIKIIEKEFDKEVE